MRPVRSQVLRFGHNSFYSRYLHGTETKIAQTGLKSFRLLDRADYVQTGMKSERDERGAYHSKKSRTLSQKSQTKILWKNPKIL